MSIEPKTGEDKRVVAIINLLVGIAVGVILAGAAVLLNEGFYILALAMFCVSQAVVFWRIRRVLAIIKD